MTFRAITTRCENWWTIEISDHPGIFSQARQLDQVAAQAADAIAFTLDVDVEPADVQVTIR